MKKYSFLFLIFVIAAANLGSRLLPANGLDSLKMAVTRTPTRRPTPRPAAQFNSSTAKRTVPSDINSVLQEVAFFGLGGGGDDEDPCEGITRPTIISEWFEVEQLQYVWTLSCGWKSSRNLSAVIVAPDGTSRTESMELFGTSNFRGAYWDYLPTAFDPVGRYRVNFSNGEQSLSFDFNVSKITKSGATLLRDDKEVQVYNFSPNEKLRIFRYDYSEDKMYLREWQEFTVASDGSLLIQISDPYLAYYAVVGQRSGEFHVTEGFGQSILKANVPVVSNQSLCSGAPKSKVAVGSTARVTFTDGTPTRIRKQPTTSSGVIGRLPEGTRFLIMGGHKCGNGYTWWNIELPNGTRGWMAEGKGNSYYLEPMNFRQQTCTDIPSFLSVGTQARVAFVDGSNMRIRSEPGFSQNIQGRVPEGTNLVILNGPRCVDGTNWWYIRTNDGQEGWMTESQNGVFLLERR